MVSTQGFQPCREGFKSPTHYKVTVQEVTVKYLAVFDSFGSEKLLSAIESVINVNQSFVGWRSGYLTCAHSQENSGSNPLPATYSLLV